MKEVLIKITDEFLKDSAFDVCPVYDDQGYLVGCKIAKKDIDSAPTIIGADKEKE